MGSDHALARVQGSLLRPSPPSQDDSTDLGFVIDEEKGEEWQKCFKDKLGTIEPLPVRPVAAQIDTLAGQVHEAMQHATAKTMKPRKPYHPKSAPWWNMDCAEVVTALRAAESEEERKRQSARLQAAARKAKRSWADEVIGKSNLWEVATWRHGRRMNKVPPLRVGEGLAHSHADIAQTLSNRFFVDAPPEVPRRMEDDPPSKPTRALPAFPDSLIGELLANTSNTSSPGTSGQT